MSWLPKRPSGHRGLTLLEMLVTLAVGTMLIGVLLGIFITTQRTVTRGQDRLAMQMAAQNIVRDVSTLLSRDAVRPSALDTALSETPEFGGGLCRVIDLPHPAEHGVRWTTVRNDDSTGVSRVMLFSSNPQGVKSKPKPAGGVGERLASRIAFRYAHEIDQARLTPVFVEQMPAGEYPDLVEIRVWIEDPEGELEDYEMATTVRAL